MDFDDAGKLIERKEMIFGFRENDFVDMNGRKARVMGVVEKRELALDVGSTVEYRSSPDGLNLLIRSGFDFAVGQVVKAMSAAAPFNGEQGYILAIEPTTEMVLVQFDKYVKNVSETTWMACPFANGPSRVWLNPSMAAHKLVKISQNGHKAITGASVGERISYPNVEGTDDVRPMPEWFQEFLHQAKAGLSHCFMFWGNINDWQKRLNGQYQTLNAFLTDTFKEHDFVMYYSISTGLRFATDKMESDFKDRYLKPKALAKKPGIGADPQEVAMFKAMQERFSTMSVNEILKGSSPDIIFPAVEMALIDNKKFNDKAAPGSVMIVEYAHHVFPKDEMQGNTPYIQRVISETMQRWAADIRIRTRMNVIAMITPDFFGVDTDLRTSSGVHAIQIKVPDEKARAERWNYWLSSGGVIVEPGMEASKLGRVSTGFSLRDIDGLYRLAATKQKPLTYGALKARKAAIYKERFGERVTVLEPEFGFDYFGGRDEVKEFMLEMIHNMESGMLRRVPMGILAAGQPGTGKSFLFQCCAYECKFNYIEFSNPRSPYVGIAEEQMQKMLLAAEELAPVFVFEDEADQSESSRDAFDGDSGVSARLRQMKFIFCADPKRRGKVVWIRVSNRDDLIDSAYTRKGRTDEVIPFVFQSEKEMRDIFRVMFKRYNIPTTVKDFAPFAHAAKDKIYCVGADIEWMVRKADKLAGRAKRQSVTEEELMRAVDMWELKNSGVGIDRQAKAALVGSSQELRPDGWQDTLKQVNERLAKAGARRTDGYEPRPTVPLGNMEEGIASDATRRALRNDRRIG